MAMNGFFLMTLAVALSMMLIPFAKKLAPRLGVSGRYSTTPLVWSETMLERQTSSPAQKKRATLKLLRELRLTALVDVPPKSEHPPRL